MKKYFILVFFLICFSFFSKQIYAANLIINPSFEINDSSWKTNNSSVTFSAINDNAFEGSRSAKITNTKTSSYGVEQILTDVSPSLTYKISGSIKLIPPYPDKTYLRIAWYKSADASGSQTSTDDSAFAISTNNWQNIEFIKTPPEGINSTKLRLLVTSGTAYFDNINFEEYFAPTPTITPTPSLTPAPVPEPTLELTATPISFGRIYLSEAMVNPYTGQNEWLELYNDNDFSADLINWYIDDTENSGSTPKEFSTTVPAKGYAVIDLTSSIFNNDQDTVRLLDFNKVQKDSFEYSISQKGVSLARTSFDAEIFCFQNPSKGEKNGGCLENTPTPAPSPTISIQTPTIQDNKPQLLTTVSSQKNNPLPQDQSSLSQPEPTDEIQNDGEILGVNDDTSKNNSTPLISTSLSFVSFSYSLLTIVSLFLKIKSTV